MDNHALGWKGGEIKTQTHSLFYGYFYYVVDIIQQERKMWCNINQNLNDLKKIVTWLLFCHNIWNWFEGINESFLKIFYQ
jgi:hypothetical protein